jgi:hypothetical protein
MTRLNASGSGLVYSTYLGGSAPAGSVNFSGVEIGTGIAVDGLPSPNAYIVGFTGSGNFPTTNGAFDTTFGGPSGSTDAFVAKIGDRIGGYEIVSQRVLVPASTANFVTIACSTGNKVLGGGFSIETPTFVRVVSEDPTDGLGTLSDRHWTVAAQNTDPNNARQVTVVAICAPASLLIGHEIVSQQILVPASGSANVNVTCSSGNVVTGGGFSIEGAIVQALTSEPSDGLGNVADNRWNVFAQNTDPNNARQVTVSAVCASQTALAGHEIVSQQVSVPASGVGTANVTCSSGKRVFGGGFDISAPAVGVFNSTPTDGLSNISDRRWNLATQNTDPANAHQITVTGVCGTM